MSRHKTIEDLQTRQRFYQELNVYHHLCQRFREAVSKYKVVALKFATMNDQGVNHPMVTWLNEPLHDLALPAPQTTTSVWSTRSSVDVQKHLTHLLTKIARLQYLFDHPIKDITHIRDYIEHRRRIESNWVATLHQLQVAQRDAKTLNLVFHVQNDNQSETFTECVPPVHIRTTETSDITQIITQIQQHNQEIDKQLSNLHEHLWTIEHYNETLTEREFKEYHNKRKRISLASLVKRFLQYRIQVDSLSSLVQFHISETRNCVVSGELKMLVHKKGTTQMVYQDVVARSSHTIAKLAWTVLKWARNERNGHRLSNHFPEMQANASSLLYYAQLKPNHLLPTEIVNMILEFLHISELT